MSARGMVTFALVIAAFFAGLFYVAGLILR